MIPIEVPLDTGDFRLMSRASSWPSAQLRESHRFVRGMVAWIGFKQTEVLYDRPGRFAGETKYPLRKMVRFALDGITSFSILPLRFATYLGMVMIVACLGVVAWALVAKYVAAPRGRGWTGIIIAVAAFASVQLLMVGILGEYVGRIYEEVKRRPLYLVAETVRVTEDDDELDEPPPPDA